MKAAILEKVGDVCDILLLLITGRGGVDAICLWDEVIGNPLDL